MAEVRKKRQHGSKKSKPTDDDAQSKRPPVPSKPEQTHFDETIALRDPSLLSDTFAQAIRRHFADSTSLEQDDSHLPARAFRDTTSFGHSRVAKELPEFLKTFSQPGDDDLSTCKEPAAPHTIIIASSGIRVADLARELRVFTSKDSKVGKYFSKHMKLQANIAFANKTKVGIAVGTPMRLKELIEKNAIRPAALQRIVVDGSYQNDKKFTIIEMNESFTPMLELLNVENIKSRLLDEDDSLQVMVF